MAGQIGFDEGGVLEALSKPVISHTTTKTKTNKAGKVTTETTVLEISVATILSLYLFTRLVALFGEKSSWEPGQLAGEAAEDLKNWLDENRPGWVFKK